MNVLGHKHTLTRVKEYEGSGSQTLPMEITLGVGISKCFEFLGQNYKWRNLSKLNILYIIRKFLKCGC
jgi:hypothetical protein